MTYVLGLVSTYIHKDIIINKEFPKNAVSPTTRQSVQSNNLSGNAP